jgi:hypothetical protein
MKTAAFQSLARRALSIAGIAAGFALGAAAVHSQTRTSVHPYLEVQQVVTADFNGGDVLTYTGVGGGIDATVATRRVTAAISYNYQRRIAWEGGIRDDDVHSGVAALQVWAIPEMLALDAGVMAARSHADIRAPVPGLRTVDDANVAEIYSAYVGPSLSTHAGPVAINAAYRLGYVHVDDHSLAGTLPPGAPRVSRYSSSTVHNATVSAGMEPGRLPVGWTVGAGYVREDMNRLDGTFEAKYVRGDVVVPVSPTLAVTAGVGYEDIHASQQDVLRDAGGVPVIGPGGNLIADPSRPRLVTYDDAGLMWDAGVIWRPSPRTELQARVGRRYGGTTFTGSLEHRINESYGLTASVYDSVDSFGRLLVTDLAGVPRNFRVPRNGLNSGVGGIGGCIIGSDPGTGACFDDALQSIANFNFRNRGANILLSGGRGPWSYNAGAAYSNRRYLAPPNGGFVVDGVTDQSFSLHAGASRQLTRHSGFDLAATADWFDSGIAGADSSFSTGVTAGYYRNILNERLQANIAAGLYTTQAGEFDSTVASILFGLRYSF